MRRTLGGGKTKKGKEKTDIQGRIQTQGTVGEAKTECELVCTPTLSPWQVPVQGLQTVPLATYTDYRDTEGVYRKMSFQTEYNRYPSV